MFGAIGSESKQDLIGAAANFIFIDAQGGSGIRLGVEDQLKQHFLAKHAKVGAQINRRCRFTDPTFLVDERINSGHKFKNDQGRMVIRLAFTSSSVGTPVLQVA